MVTNEQLGRGIRRARMQAGLSQAELARRLDVTRASVANWETGVMAPRFKTAIAIAEALGCKTDDFVR